MAQIKEKKGKLIGKISGKSSLKGSLNGLGVTVYPELEDLEVTPKLIEQNFKSQKYGYNNIKVKKIQTENLTITPTLQGQTFEGIYNKVIVDPIEGETLIVNPTTNEQNHEGLYTTVNVNAVDITTLDDYVKCLEISKNILGEETDTEGDNTDTVVEDYVQDGLVMYYDARQYESGDKITDLINGADATIVGTEYSKSDLGIKLDGAYITTGDISQYHGVGSGTWEIYFKVDSDFTPAQSSYWYMESSIFGCELSGEQQDFAAFIESDGTFSLGYATQSTHSTGVKVNDGQFHHVCIVYDEDTMYTNMFKVYLDNVSYGTTVWNLTGETPSTYGLFWNNANLETITHGEFFCFRYYPRVLSDEERTTNYEQCINAYTEGV